MMRHVYIVQQYDDADSIEGVPVGVFSNEASAYEEAGYLNKEYATGVILDENNEYVGRISDSGYHYYVVSFWIVDEGAKN